MSCVVCNFEVSIDGFCTFHALTYCYCRSCGDVTPSKSSFYCEDCIAKSKGRCSDCSMLIKQEEKALFLCEPRIGSIGRFICSTCHKKRAPLAYLSDASLQDPIVFWKPKGSLALDVSSLKPYKIKLSYPIIKGYDGKAFVDVEKAFKVLGQSEKKIYIVISKEPSNVVYYSGHAAAKFITTWAYLFKHPSIIVNNINQDRTLSYIEWQPLKHDEANGTIIIPECKLPIILHRLAAIENSRIVKER